MIVRYLLFLVSNLLLGSWIFAQAPTLSTQWAKKMGGIAHDEGVSIVVDGDGFIYTAGIFNHLVDFDPGPGAFNLFSAGGTDIFITKFDPSGNLVWAKRMGGVQTDFVNAISVDQSGNVYSTGYFYGTADFDPGEGIYNLTAFGLNDVFISKLDASGNFVWAKQLGGASTDGGIALCTDSNGNIFVAGGFSDSADFNPDTLSTHYLHSNGDFDFFIVKLDSAGQFIWAKSIGGGGNDYINAIKIDHSGYLYAVGSFFDVVDFDPGINKHYLTGTGFSDIFALKLDTEGNFIWAKQISGTGYSGCTSMAVDVMKNILFTGWFTGTSDFDPGTGTLNKTSSGGADVFFAKLDSSGAMIWAKTVGGIVNDFGSSVDVDKSGALYATGYFGDVVDFDPGAAEYPLIASGDYEIFVLKLNNSGDLVWAASIGGSYSDYSTSIAVDNDGNTITTGSFMATADFDPGPGKHLLTSSGGADIFICKMGEGSVGILPYSASPKMTISPNPSQGNLHIRINSGNYPLLILNIYNAYGQLVMTEMSNTNQITLDIKDLPTGVYFAKAMSSDHQIIASQKIIKQ